MLRTLKTLIPTTKTLLPPPPPPPHSLLPRSPVSGTAKGKAKTKDGQALKRNVITRKKPAGSSPSPTRGRARHEATERMLRTAESCLNAPTPIRHLSPNDRYREAERAKLGLVSKDRQRELDMAKKKQAPDPVIMGTPGLDYISLGLVDADKIPKYELTVEDGRKLAKEYSRVLMRKHRARQAAESTLLRLKKEAVAALPEGLREAAMVPDLTPFPANRYMATLTPPIEGYIDKVREAANKYSMKGRK